MFNAESLQEKWAPVLGHEGASPIGDKYKKGCYLCPPGKPRTLPTRRAWNAKRSCS